MLPVADVVVGAVEDVVAGDMELGEEASCDDVTGDTGPGDVGGAAVHAASASVTSGMNLRRPDVVERLTQALWRHRSSSTRWLRGEPAAHPGGMQKQHR